MTTVAPAAQCILDQATDLWPNRSRISDGTVGDAAHAARTSDHNPDERGIVHAADLTHDPANGCDAHFWADQARQRAKAGKEPRLKYVISNRRIASPSSGWEWVAYDGSNPHEHHAHFSVNSGAVENDTSPWFVKQGGLMPDEVQDIKQAINKLGERIVAAIKDGNKAQTKSLRRAVWAAQGKTADEIDELEAKLGDD